MPTGMLTNFLQNNWLEWQILAGPPFCLYTVSSDLFFFQLVEQAYNLRK